jgi:hypothetical protein
MQTKVSCNEKYYDHDADDVENIHCVLRLRLRYFNMKYRYFKLNVWHVSKFHIYALVSLVGPIEKTSLLAFAQPRHHERIACAT